MSSARSECFIEKGAVLGDPVVVGIGQRQRKVILTVDPPLERGFDQAHLPERPRRWRNGVRLAEKLEVDMPITRAVSELLDGKTSASDLLNGLLQREPKQESVR